MLAAAGIIILAGRHSPFGKRNTSFASKPKKEITRIVFTSDSKELTLENVNGKWLLNGKLETRKSSINFILKILKEIDIKSPVSPHQFDTTVTRKNIAPLRARIYENRKMLNDFLVYKTRSNVYGNMMKKGKRNKPFIVYVPGHDTDIGSAFTVNELYWQPYTIFSLLASEIISVDFENLNDEGETFSISKNDSGYTLTDGEKPVAGFDTSLVKRYLTYFTFIPFETWTEDMNESIRDSILESPPLYRIKVRTKSAEIFLSLWKKTNPDGSADSDRLYGRTNSADALFVVRYFDIDPILKKGEYFFNKEQSF